MAFFDRAKSDAEIRAIRQNVNPSYDEKRRLLIKGIAVAATSGVLASTAHGVASAESDEYGSPNTLPITSRLRGVDTAATYGGFFDFSGVDSPRLPENFTRDLYEKVKGIGFDVFCSGVRVLPVRDRRFERSLKDTYDFDQIYSGDSFTPIVYEWYEDSKKAILCVANYDGQTIQTALHELTHAFEEWMLIQGRNKKFSEAFSAFNTVYADLNAYQQRDIQTRPYSQSRLFSQYEKDILKCGCLVVSNAMLTKIAGVLGVTPTALTSQESIKDALKAHKNPETGEILRGFLEWTRRAGIQGQFQGDIFVNYLMGGIINSDIGITNFVRRIDRNIGEREMKLESRVWQIFSGIEKEGIAELFANFHTLAPSMNGVPQKFKDNLHKIILK